MSPGRAIRWLRGAGPGKGRRGVEPCALGSRGNSQARSKAQFSGPWHHYTGHCPPGAHQEKSERQPSPHRVSLEGPLGPSPQGFLSLLFTSWRLRSGPTPQAPFPSPGGHPVLDLVTAASPAASGSWLRPLCWFSRLPLGQIQQCHSHSGSLSPLQPTSVTAAFTTSHRLWILVPALPLPQPSPTPTLGFSGVNVGCPLALPHPTPLPSQNQALCAQLGRARALAHSDPLSLLSGLHSPPTSSSIWLLLKNPTFILLCLAGATEATLIAGMSTFGPKFLESQFSLSASEAATLFGENVP